MERKPMAPKVKRDRPACAAGVLRGDTLDLAHFAPGMLASVNRVAASSIRRIPAAVPNPYLCDGEWDAPEPPRAA